MTSYSILVTKHADDQYSARVLAVPDVIVSGTSEAEVLEQLRAELTNLQSHSYVVQIDIPSSGKTAGDPWLRFAGLWEHDPDWELFQQEVAAYRAEIDAQTVAE